MTKRIFWLVIIGYLLVTAYFVSWTYFQYTEQAEQSSLFRLEGIAEDAPVGGIGVSRIGRRAVRRRSRPERSQLQRAGSRAAGRR